ncbi:MCE family protein [Mycobacterium sp. 1465703.0]|uniref:MCE family protein n=1 Tax=Mycobacterium sp. 1465703.0 TaxID=1834078 RepID=UPI0007FEA9BA|nr:MlaD family protein [Mycobacterium sp. 1465703.0]OBJ08849.1 mammalian cell entry protein [Mycobacterium sp. 1465703.0]
MHLDRRIRIQLVIVAVITVVAGAVMVFGYMKIPTEVLGVGRYTVTVQLPEGGGLYATSNVTYRGTEVGRVASVSLDGRGVVAVLSLKSDVPIPADVRAEIHSVSAIGEQYVALVPGEAAAGRLKNGDVITSDRTSVPLPVDRLLDTVNAGLEAIPQDNLQVAVEEAYTAVHGLGPEISRIIKGGTALAVGAHDNLDSITTLIDQSPTLLDSQTDTADSIHAWAANLATVTGQLHRSDAALAGVLQKAPAATQEAWQLIDRVKPALPILMTNLASLGEITLVYNPNIEQVLVLLPQIINQGNGASLANQTAAGPFRAAQFLNLNININVPPPCLTGYLPAQQQRSPALEDYPDRPQGDLFCRVPKDSPLDVRGARNIPCARVPGKRAPTAKLCNSDEQYQPLNDGFNWKGDPNATLSGQGVPFLSPGAMPPQAPVAAPPLAVAPYDPATGKYLGPDGRVYTQSDLAQSTTTEKSWQSMLLPPGRP